MHARRAETYAYEIGYGVNGLICHLSFGSTTTFKVVSRAITAVVLHINTFTL